MQKSGLRGTLFDYYGGILFNYYLHPSRNQQSTGMRFSSMQKYKKELIVWKIRFEKEEN